MRLKNCFNLFSISLLFWHNWSRFLSCHLLIEFSRRINASPLERDTSSGGHYRAFLDQVEFRASFPLQVWFSVPPCTLRGNVVPTGHSSTPAPHTHPVSTRCLFIPRKGTKPICFYSKPDLSVRSLILIIIQVLPQYSYRQPCH